MRSRRPFDRCALRVPLNSLTALNVRRRFPLVRNDARGGLQATRQASIRAQLRPQIDAPPLELHLWRLLCCGDRQ